MEELYLERIPKKNTFTIQERNHKIYIKKEG